MKKILFTDLDGTLLREDKTVSFRNRQAIEALLEAGNYLVIATGRPSKSGLDVVRSLGLNRPGCYLIAYNGGAMYDCAGECLLEQRTLPISCVEYLFSEARRYGLHIQTYQGEALLTERHTRELDFYVEHSTMDFRILPDVPKALTREPHKVLLASLNAEERLQEFQREHLCWERDRCCSFFSGREYLEYCPRGVDKGYGIRRLAEILHVPLEQTWAAGDERNDVPMLLAAGTGVAMRNGHPDAKEAAGYVTEHDNDHDAIAELIERFGLNRKSEKNHLPA